MVSENKVEFLSIKKKSGDKFDLALKIENAKKHFDVNIIDRDGIFGVDMPSELGLLLREFPMSHKEVVNSVQTAYREIFSNQLQAA